VAVGGGGWRCPGKGVESSPANSNGISRCDPPFCGKTRFTVKMVGGRREATSPEKGYNAASARKGAEEVELDEAGRSRTKRN
jgi:hypothetical protein